MSEDLGKEYWSLANAITGFAAVQSLAFTYAVAEHGDKIRSAKEWVTSGILLGAIAFCVAVWFCNRAQTTILSLSTLQDSSPAVARCLRRTMIGRILGIAGYALFSVGILWLTGTNVTGAE